MLNATNEDSRRFNQIALRLREPHVTVDGGFYEEGGEVVARILVAALAGDRTPREYKSKGTTIAEAFDRMDALISAA